MLSIGVLRGMSISSRGFGKEGCHLLKRPDADTSAAPHSSKLPASRFIRAALKIVAHGQIDWNKTVTRKFSTVRRRVNVRIKERERSRNDQDEEDQMEKG
jgi:hypothetical protein